jgi:succinate dehydrogenase/fumarate reductase flavoprotein subunit
MGFARSAVALIASIALATSLGGCFGYNQSAKRWSYVGDSVLIAGGGAAIAIDVTSKDAPCTGDNCTYRSSIHGAMIAGIVLVAAGVFGIVFNATRDNVKTTR